MTKLDTKKLWWLLPVACIGVYFLPVIAGRIIAPLDIMYSFYDPWSNGTHGVQVHNHFCEDLPHLWLGERLFAWNSFRTEGWNGWSDLTFSGTAQYANTMNMYYDWTMQLNRWLLLWDAWHLGLFAHLVLAAVGMGILLRSRALSPSAALLGALCYALNSLFFTWIFHSWMLGAFCWLPWFVWSLYQLREGKRIGSLAPVFLGLGFLGGQLQFAAFYFILTMALCLLWVYEDFPKSSWKSLRWIGIFGAIGILAVGMSAFMFVPCTRAYFRTLEAGLVRGEIGYPGGWMQPFANLILYPTYIFPYLLGRPQSLDFAKALHSDLFNVPFIGSLPMILASVYGYRVLANRGGERGAVLFMLLGLVLPLTFLVGPLYQRRLLLFGFGASWAAALALDEPDIVNSKNIATFLWRGFLVVTDVWVAGSAAVFVFQAELQQKLAALIAPLIAGHRRILFQDWWQMRIERALSDFQIWSPEMLVPWLAFGVAVFAYRRHSQARLSRNGFVTVLIATTALQLFWFNKNWISYSDRPVAEIPSFEGQDFLQSQIRPWHRVATVQRAGSPAFFPLNTLNLYGIPHHQGYGSIIPPGIQCRLKFDTSADDLDPSFYGKLGVTHAIGRFDEAGLPDGWKLVGRDGQVSLFANTLSRSRYEAEVGSSVASLDPEVHEMNFRRLLLPENASTVNVLENWDEGWEFRIDSGDWTAMKRADDRTMTAEFSPTPKPSVFEMRYRPLARLAGQVISLVSLGIYIIAAGLVLKLASRRISA